MSRLGVMVPLKKPAMRIMTIGARLEDKIFGAPSSKQQAPSLTSFKLQDIMGVEREGKYE